MGDFFMRRCPTFRLPPWQGSRAEGSKGSPTRAATIPAPTVAAVNAEVPIEGWQLLVDSYFQFSELATL
jgi:hypothetical protein